MKTVALVPFKSFGHAKGRLRGRFADGDVETIGRAMLADVLSTLHASPSVARTRVLTDDPSVARAAEEAGAEARVRIPDPGLNPAIEEANREAEAEGCAATLVVLGDLPLLRACDVAAVCEAGRSFPVVLVPSVDGGTALLLRSPPSVIPACFGPRSFERHLQACAERGVTAHVPEGIPEAVRTDLDTPADAQRIVDAGGEGRTVGVLRRLVE